MNGYNFSPRVRRTLQGARDVAGQLGHEYVGTEHLLLALLVDRECDGARGLAASGLDLDAIDRMTRDIMTPGGAPPRHGPELPYTSRAKKVLELSMLEARERGDTFVGTGHLMLGLLREERGIAAQVLAQHGMTLDRLRSATGQSEGGASDPNAAPPSAVPGAPAAIRSPDTIARVVAVVALLLALLALARG